MKNNHSVFDKASTVLVEAQVNLTNQMWFSMVDHILICFLPQYQRQRKFFFRARA